MGGMNSSTNARRVPPIRVETYNYNWSDVIKKFCFKMTGGSRESPARLTFLPSYNKTRT